MRTKNSFKSKICSLFIILIFFQFISCDLNTPEDNANTSKNIANPSSEFTNCPANIAGRALYFGYEYAGNDTEYLWGGQDWLPRTIRVDCSGLVVNCYKYAIAGTRFRLPFYDAAVIDFYTRWSVPTKNPRPGDLIFMGDDKNKPPTHICLFVRREGGTIYFIDATDRYEGDEYINGVSERHYSENDPRILGYGLLQLWEY
jgi:hypothetical protein